MTLKRVEGPCTEHASVATMLDMVEDNAGSVNRWWQGLTEDGRDTFRDLKAGDPFPLDQLTPYTRASLVVGSQDRVQQGSDHHVNDRLGAFLASERA